MTLGIIGNLNKPELTEAVSLFVQRLERSGMDFMLEERIASLLSSDAPEIPRHRRGSEEECVRAAEILVAFGGDGTILSAARAVGASRVPILGINLGKLGFLAEVAPSEINEAIQDLIEQRYVLEERLLLQGTSPGLPGSVLQAVNDIVIKSRSSRMIDLQTHVNGAFAVNYRGDGLIVSTPTGSTAYALSNGGPIVIPTCQVLGLTPISPHTLSGRPLIIPDDSVVQIFVHAEGDDVLISADGQEEYLMKPPLEFNIRKADHDLRLVRRLKHSYFELLRAKLLWGKDPRSP
jgi:NAD+ kinase